MKSSVTIFILANQLAAWKITSINSPQRLKIQGQLILHVSSRETLVAAYSDLFERLHGDGVNPVEVHWIIDRQSREVWYESLPLLEKNREQIPVWQNLSWEWLATRFGLSLAQNLALPTMIENEILPWLVTADDAIERQQMKDCLEREHQSESERLVAERSHLQRENERLQAQNTALQRVDAEQLLSFLPALFSRVFTILGAADLALLCGRVEPLSIPNPYPEPSEETLRTLQKRFRALSPDFQAQIVRFIAHLPHRQKLTPRPEMRELISELEEM